MKKYIGIAAVMILTAGIGHAGDSFGIAIGPHGFDLHFGSYYGAWLPPPPPPPPVYGYYGGWWAPYYSWGRPRGAWNGPRWDRRPAYRAPGHFPHHDGWGWRDHHRPHYPRDRRR